MAGALATAKRESKTSQESHARKPRSEPATPKRLPTPAGPPLFAASEPESRRAQPLPPGVRTHMEGSFGEDFSSVRVHHDGSANNAVRSLGATAVATGEDIYFADGHYQPESSEGRYLLAHELTHVVQQRRGQDGAHASAGDSGDRYEVEAEGNATRVSSGQRAQVNESAHPREGQTSLTSWAINKAMNWLHNHFPDLADILEMGIGEWLKQKISNAVSALIDTLLAPVRLVAGIASSLHDHFGNLIKWIQTAFASIMRGDCSTLHEGIHYVEQVIEGLGARVIDKIKVVFDKVSGFFHGIWDHFGAPIWDWIKRVGGKVWDVISNIASWIWDKTEWIRSYLGRAWKWIKNKLGIGDGPEGQNGLLQWFQAKASAAWDYIKEKLAPFKKPLMVIAGVVIMLSPAGPVIAVGAAVVGVLKAIKWIKQHMSTPNGVVDQRNVLQREILPMLTGGVRAFAKKLGEVGRGIAGALQRLANSFSSSAGELTGTILGFLGRFLGWLADKFGELVNWATEKLLGLVALVEPAMERLAHFLETVLHALGEIAKAILNIMYLPFLLAGKLWNLIPACIRDPFVNFLVQVILKRIPIFSELVGTPEAWKQTKSEVMEIIHLVFKNFDLMGAMKKTFALLLRALKVPIELFRIVLAKAAQAWDAILDKPIEFVINILRALRMAFGIFFGRIKSEIAFGLEEWLFGQISSAGIRPPSSWTNLREVFGLVLQILGITVDHIFELIARRFGEERARKLRRIASAAGTAWDWLMTAIREGPAAIWERLMERLSDLAKTIFNAALDWIMSKIIAAVAQKLLTMLDPTGIMAVVNALIAFYRAIQTAIQYATRILQMVNRMLDGVLDLAKGVLTGVADVFVDAMHRSMPVVIGFLGNLFGLGGIGNRIREIVEDIRERVDKALMWLIEKGAAAIDTVVGAAKSAAAAVMEWWRRKVGFKIGEESHSLYFSGDEQNAALMVQSDPMPIQAFLDSKRADPTFKEKRDTIAAAQRLVNKLEEFKNSQFGRAQGVKIAEMQDELAEKLSELDFRKKDLPETKVRLMPGKIGTSTVGWRMIADPLSLKPGSFDVISPVTLPQPSENRREKAPRAKRTVDATIDMTTGDEAMAGSRPRGHTALWDAVRQRRNVYVRGHLLNHNLFGPGTEPNLTPITIGNNNRMKDECEDKVKKAVLEEGKVVRYTVEITYPFAGQAGKHIDEEADLAKHIEMRAVDISPDAKKKNEVIGEASIDADVPINTKP